MSNSGVIKLKVQSYQVMGLRSLKKICDQRNFKNSQLGYRMFKLVEKLCNFVNENRETRETCVSGLRGQCLHRARYSSRV